MATPKVVPLHLKGNKGTLETDDYTKEAVAKVEAGYVDTLDDAGEDPNSDKNDAKLEDQINSIMRESSSPSLKLGKRRGSAGIMSGGLMYELEIASRGGGMLSSVYPLLKLSSVSFLGGLTPSFLVAAIPFSDPSGDPYSAPFHIYNILSQCGVGVAAVLWQVNSSGGDILSGFNTSKWRNTFIASISFALGVVATLVVSIEVLDAFPMPFYILAGLPGCICQIVTIYHFLPVVVRTNWRSRVQFLRGAITLLFAFFFCACLVIARIVFMSLSAGDQTLFSVVFFLLKIALKNIVKFISRGSDNPDFEAVLAYWFDLMSGIFTNILFVSC